MLVRTETRSDFQCIHHAIASLQFITTLHIVTERLFSKGYIDTLNSDQSYVAMYVSSLSHALYGVSERLALRRTSLSNVSGHHMNKTAVKFGSPLPKASSFSLSCSDFF